MEQMNKEDIIEYFIEQFGDNEILRRFMTKEQMRNKLNLMIKEVTYEEEPGSTLASWRPRLDGTGCVNFDMTKTNPEKLKSSILHEFIHILSSSFYNINGTVYYSKVGIRFSCTSEHFKCWNVGINEGITEALAEKIIEKKTISFST